MHGEECRSEAEMLLQSHDLEFQNRARNASALLAIENLSSHQSCSTSKKVMDSGQRRHVNASLYLVTSNTIEQPRPYISS